MIEHFLRDRTTALSSAPGDLGSFGATASTFQPWLAESARPLASEIGAIGSTGAKSGENETSSYQNHSVALDSDVLLATHDVVAPGAMSSGASLGISTEIALMTATQQGSGSIVTSADIATGGTLAGQGVILASMPQQGVQSSDTTAPAPIPAQAGENAAGTTTPVADPAAQVQVAIATHVAQVQGVVAEHIAQAQDAIDASVTAIVSQIDAMANSLHGLTPPAIALAQVIPDTLDLDIAQGLDLGLGAAIELGGTSIAIDAAAALSIASSLHLDLPIGGSDIAGGIQTLSSLLDHGDAYAIADPDSGFLWAAENVAGDGGLIDLLASETAPILDDVVSPASVLLGIAGEDTHLLGGLLDDHHGHG